MAEKLKFSVAIKSDAYKNLINNTLGDPETAKRFVAEVSTVVGNNYALSNCDAGSIISAALLAQTLKLPLSPTLGFAYLIPYKDRCTFQMGWKGLVQLAQRSGLYKTIGVRPVHVGEYAGQDEFGEDQFKFSHEYDDTPVVGYFAYFRLENGFQKTLYWTKKQVEAHAQRYSQAVKFKKDTPWVSDFDLMAQKTVLKQLISKYGPMSVDIQKAVVFDQAVVNGDTPEYVDNEPEKASNGAVANQALGSEEPKKEYLADEDKLEEFDPEEKF